MKLVINKNQIDMAPAQWLRRAGYGYIRDRKTGHDSFVRRLGSGFYPRFHMYFNESDGKIIFNLHLDQKQASYPGAHKHNAEYEGETVVAEISRLKNLLASSLFEEKGDFHDEKQMDKIGRGKYNEMTEKKKESWWKRLFA